MMSGWRQTRRGEWVLDGVGLVAESGPLGWLAYPFGRAATLGPYDTLREAQRALKAFLSRRLC
jgi:hypothetical protein